MKAGLTTCTDTLSCIMRMTWFAMAGGAPPECTSMHANMRFSMTCGTADHKLRCIACRMRVHAYADLSVSCNPTSCI